MKVFDHRQTMVMRKDMKLCSYFAKKENVNEESLVTMQKINELELRFY